MSSATVIAEDEPVRKRLTLEQLMSMANDTDFKIVDGYGALYLLDQALSPILDNPQAGVTSLPLFVSIDTEFYPNRILELGISTFDPHNLTSTYQAPVRDPEETIFSFWYTKPEAQFRSHNKPCLFGPRQDLNDHNLLGLVINALNPKDIHGNPREVILIGHAIKCDIKVLKKSSGLDLRCAPNVKAIVDTQTVSAAILGSTQCVKLKSLLTCLGLEYTGLHNAAHDSRYTLRALLMMYCVLKQTFLDPTEENYSSSVARLDLIERVAKSHRVTIPNTWCRPNVWTDCIDPRLLMED